LSTGQIHIPEDAIGSILRKKCCTSRYSLPLMQRRANQVPSLQAQARRCVLRRKQINDGQCKFRANIRAIFHETDDVNAGTGASTFTASVGPKRSILGFTPPPVAPRTQERPSDQPSPTARAPFQERQRSAPPAKREAEEVNEIEQESSGSGFCANRTPASALNRLVSDESDDDDLLPLVDQSALFVVSSESDSDPDK
jgi:hypothetical protein